MDKIFIKIINSLLILFICIWTNTELVNANELQPEFEDYFARAEQTTDIEQNFDSSQFKISGKISRLVLVEDKNDTKRVISVPLGQSFFLDDTGSNFSITYISEPFKDVFGQPCYAYPNDAINAFDFASTIWATTIVSSVPITIRACWADLGTTNILGYSGSYNHINFPNNPLPNTWYSSSLANSFIGSDYSPGNYDIHITFNKNYDWYFGIDANPPLNTMDFVTVATHEIAHGLNFSGTAMYDSGTYTLGWEGYPNIYDRFIKNGTGISIVDYIGSINLGSQLISDDLWFHGSKAMLANQGTRVKIYAPPIWKAGSSYSHLDYNTFSNTDNGLMVYAISSGTAYHNPGPVTIGLLQDLGWQINNVAPGIPSGVSASDGLFVDRVQISWNLVGGATSYSVFRHDENSFIDSLEFTNSAITSPYNDFSAEPGVDYYYWVIACNGSTCSDESNPDTGFRLIGQSVFLPLVVK